MKNLGIDRRPGDLRTLRSLVRKSAMTGLCVLLLAQTDALSPAQEPVTAQAQPANPQPPELPRDTAKAGQDQLPSAPLPQASRLQPQSPTGQESSSSQQPVGTATAPYEKPTGVPGSRPAGAAIAPAKQRRVRAIVIKVGLVLAGAGAVGAVVGLSKASRSQP